MGLNLPSGYKITLGKTTEQVLLTQFAQATYQEIFLIQQDYSYLKTTIKNHLSSQTPLWWVKTDEEQTIGCLWLGNAYDPLTNDRYAQIFLLFVLPQHRRQGIGSYLLQTAEKWSQGRGDRKIGLEVLASNQNAVNLYHKLGFVTNSWLMTKSLSSGSENS